MINIYIQFLILCSGLLVNFLIPVLFGLEEYGLFIKANILVFLFHKFTDVVSEPLISNVDKKILLPVSVSIGVCILFLFLIVNCFFSAGSPFLLASMIWSSSVLLTIIAQKLTKWVVFYLSTFIIIFLSLLFSVAFKVISLSITDVMGITNFVPATFCLFVLLGTKQLEIAFDKIYLNFIIMLQLIPRLFSLTLVNNLFTNILPFYLSFVFPPQLLGLFRVQVSIVQSVIAIFPINSKIISAYFRESHSGNNFIEHTLRISLNYFCIIALFGYIFVGLYEDKLEYAQVFILLPVMHAAVILERYMLGLSKNKNLIIINLMVSILSCFLVLWVQTISQMMLLYSTGISLYLLSMLFVTNSFKFKKLVCLIAVSTPLIVFFSIHSGLVGVVSLLFFALMVFLFIPVNKQSMSLLRGY